jgi:hypothetical protein
MPTVLSGAVGGGPKRPSRTLPNRKSDVLAVQRLLNTSQKKTGVPRNKIAEDGDVGPETIGAINAFQLANFGWQDGVVDPGGQTLQKLDSSAGPVAPAPGPGGSSVSEKAVLIALTQDGVREQPLGSNRGPEVDAYIRSTGLNPPAYWCMAFVYWCFQRAAAQLGATNPMYKTASCSDLYAWAKPRGLVKSTPQRGDIFLVRGGADGRTHQHTGLVVEVSGGTMKTVEGNSNDDGSSNGIGVFVRNRSAANLDFVRL